MRVLITGGTGLIGGYLQKQLLSLNAEVIVLSRTRKKSTVKGLTYAFWNIEQQIIDVEAVCRATHIVHLAGANIADGRWTAQQKQIIIDSRTQTADLIFETLKNNKHQVESIVSASGADCYGLKTTPKVFKETDSFGDDFLAEVCNLWEKSVFKFETLGIRTIYLRTGVVIAKQDSALQKMAMPIRLGIGSALGSGKQIMSYIHIKDLCSMYVKALEDVTMKGAYNAISGNHTNAEVTKAIARQLKKPLFFPKVPSFVLKLIFGEMAAILLEGSAIDNTKIKNTGFQFEYQHLEDILQDTL